MTRKRDSVKARRICFEAHKWKGPLGQWMLTCHMCKRAIDAAREREKWRADHIRRHAQGGEDTAENLPPICTDCDCGEDGKAANDTREVAKAKRVYEKHFGIRRRSGTFPKRKFQNYARDE